MSDFIVSALKYRPQDFSTVIGQEHITTTLSNAIKNDHLAHSFLFCGPRGVGKTSTARIMAKVINCENLSEDTKPCDECASCKAFNENASYNIYELDAASNNSVEDIRSLIEGVQFAPQRGQYKIYIIDEAHMLSASAFNAFLKTLEEPPSHAIFILATTEKHKIIPTILSRCQTFDFRRITTEDTMRHLREICASEDIKYEEEALQVIAQKSEGCMRDALSLMDKLVSFEMGKLTYAQVLQNLSILDHDYYFRLGSLFEQNDTAQMLLALDEILAMGFEESIVIEGLLSHYRNLLVSKNPESKELLDTVDSVKEKYIQTASETKLDLILTAMQLLNDTLVSLKNNTHKRLLTETALIKLTHLGQLFGTDPAKVTLKQEQAYLIPKPRKIYPKTSLKSKQSALKIDPEVIIPKAKKEEPNESETQAKEPQSQTANLPKTAKKSGSRVSLTALKQKKEEAKGTLALEEIEKNRKELNQENIDLCWGQFLEDFKKEHSAMDCEFIAQNQLLANGGEKIIIQSPTKSALSTIKRRDIQNRLRDHFIQYMSRTEVPMDFILDIDPEATTETIKSKHQRLSELEEENPILRELIGRLGLTLY